MFALGGSSCAFIRDPPISEYGCSGGSPQLCRRILPDQLDEHVRQLELRGHVACPFIAVRSNLILTITHHARGRRIVLVTIVYELRRKAPR